MKSLGKLGVRQWLFGLAIVIVLPVSATPRNVVSLNICTDQLLMLVGQPEQIASVTFLARDPVLSAMAQQAEEYPINHGLAEEVIRAKPDLVLASQYAARTTVQLLTGLGYRVEQIPPAFTLDQIKANLGRVGKLLGQQARSDQLLSELETKLVNLRSVEAGDRGVFTDYEVNSIIAGRGSLLASLAHEAGYDLLGEKLDIAGAGQISLETLIVAQPDLMELGHAWDESPSLASETLRHPGLTRLLTVTPTVSIPDAWWQCGLPVSLNVVELLLEAGT